MPDMGDSFCSKCGVNMGNAPGTSRCANCAPAKPAPTRWRESQVVVDKDALYKRPEEVAPDKPERDDDAE